MLLLCINVIAYDSYLLITDTLPLLLVTTFSDIMYLYCRHYGLQSQPVFTVQYSFYIVKYKKTRPGLKKRLGLIFPRIIRAIAELRITMIVKPLFMFTFVYCRSPSQLFPIIKIQFGANLVIKMLVIVGN